MAVRSAVVPRGLVPSRAEVVPAWFGGVMGTGIVAVALEMVVGPDGVAVAFWAASAVLLVGLLASRVAWRRVLADPAGAPTLGLPAMAVLTVGAATLAAGQEVLGADVAAGIAAGLWVAGTLAGLTAAVAVPLAMIARHRLQVADASGAWLLPVVPPMVSAATGAGLVAHAPAGEARLDLLLVLYALFGLGLVASGLMVVVIWAQLLLHGPGPAERAPALWVVLGPLGQSITAANLLGAAAAHAVGAPDAAALRAFGLVYGMPVLGFALLWAAIASALTVRHATRGGVPFTAAWWSYVFPTGTLATGTAQLADRTGSEALAIGAAMLLVALLVVWAVTATRSARRLSMRLL